MKRLLIVVDYQNDFVDGALGFEGAELLDDRIVDKIESYRATNDLVAYTLDTHHKDYLQTQEGQKLPIPHCIEGTEGYELYGAVALTPVDADEIFMKPTFGSAELFERLHKAQEIAEGLGVEPFESIELVGLVSNICVLANAVLARTACPNVPIIVDARCTACADPAMNEKALDVLEGIQVTVTNRNRQ